MELKGILRVVIAQATVVLPLAAVGSDYQVAGDLAPTSAQEASVGLQGVETDRILPPAAAAQSDSLGATWLPEFRRVKQGKSDHFSTQSNSRLAADDICGGS